MLQSKDAGKSLIDHVMESEKGVKVSMQQQAVIDRCLEDMSFCFVCILFYCSLPL